MRTALITSILVILCLKAWTQTKNASFRLNISQTMSEIRIDGIGDEMAWQEAEVARDFFMVTPMDTSKATDHTEIRMCYDKKYLYLLAMFNI